MSVEIINPPKQPLYIIGLTGTIGAGKSTLAKAFKATGATVIDADNIVSVLLDEHARAIANLIDETILINYKLDKRQLAQIVFDDPAKRKLLEEYLHPRVARVFLDISKFWRAMGNRIIVYDAPLLFEARHDHMVQWTVVAVANRDTRRKRAIARGMSGEQFDRRDALHYADKEKYADVIVRNEGDSVIQLAVAAEHIMRIAMESIKQEKNDEIN